MSITFYVDSKGEEPEKALRTPSVARQVGFLNLVLSR